MNATAPPAQMAQVTIEQLLAHAAWTKRLAEALVGPADADDVVQETWFAAVRVGAGARGPIAGWLRRVVERRGANRRRDERRRRAWHDAAAAVPVTPAATPEELLGRLEAERVIAAGVVALPEPFRRTILLRYYEELPSQAIGEVMGVPAGTVRRRLKEGLALLKVELEKTGIGDRVWLRVLAPSVPLDEAARPMRGSSVVRGLFVAGAVAGALTVVGFATRRRPAEVAWQSGGAPRVSVAQEVGALPTAPAALVSVAPAHGPQVSRPSGVSARCLDKVRALRAKVADARVSAAEIEQAFAAGTSNAVVQAALLPMLTRIFESGGGTSTFALECRTAACRVSLLSPPGSRNGWDRVARAPDVRARIRGISLRQEGATKDVAGTTFERASGYLMLADASGKAFPLAKGEMFARVPRAEAPLPTTSDACFAELRAATEGHREEGTNERAEIAFANGTPDAALTARMQALVTEVLRGGDRAWAPEVVCRGPSCRVVVPGFMQGETARPWHARLFASVAFRRATYDRYDVGAGGLYFLRFPNPSRPLGDDVVRALRDRIRSAPAVRDCAAQFASDTGRLTVTITLADADVPRAVDVAPLAVTWGGPLAGSSVHACIAAAVDQLVVATKIPAHVRPAEREIALDFPL